VSGQVSFPEQQDQRRDKGGEDAVEGKAECGEGGGDASKRCSLSRRDPASSDARRKAVGARIANPQGREERSPDHCGYDAANDGEGGCGEIDTNEARDGSLRSPHLGSSRAWALRSPRFGWRGRAGSPRPTDFPPRAFQLLYAWSSFCAYDT
jgi:hypothetical protein